MTTYELTYKFKSANGFDIYATIKNLTLEEADRICKNIDNLENYKLVDLSAEI